MEFDSDLDKSDKNLSERGFGFRFATRVFDGLVVEFQDSRFDYREARIIAIGEIDGNLYKVVYTDRGSVRRIISANRASRPEKRKWRLSK